MPEFTPKQLDRAVAELFGWTYTRGDGWSLIYSDDTPEFCHRRWRGSVPAYTDEVDLAMELFVALAQRASIGEWFTIEHPRGDIVRVGFANHRTHIGVDGWRGCFYLAPLCVALSCAYYEFKTGEAVVIKSGRKRTR